MSVVSQRSLLFSSLFFSSLLFSSLVPVFAVETTLSWLDIGEWFEHALGRMMNDDIPIQCTFQEMCNKLEKVSES